MSEQVTPGLRQHYELVIADLRRELENAKDALGEANANLEMRILEHTTQLERVVVQLSDALAERDASIEAQAMLAREIDHRVRNSLQMVVGILGMQASAAESPSEHRGLQQASLRVQAIAHAHGLLYRSTDSHTVSFQDYLAALCRDLQSVLAPDQQDRTVICRSEPAELPADCALPLGLVVNELVTNAFKHAFPGGRPGRVEVSFRRRKSKGWRLTVADNGVGLPSWPAPIHPHALGTRLIGSLVDRLHGRLRVGRDSGTQFIIDIDPDARPSSDRRLN